MKSNPGRKINVLVVDDSALIRTFLVNILESDPYVNVIGTAKNGHEALDFIKIQVPDVISMDIYMPSMDGFETTRIIMQTNPIPIAIVSGHYEVGEVAKTFRSLEVGAVAILPRPKGPGDPEHERSAADFIRTMKTISEVKLVKRYFHGPSVLPENHLRNEPFTKTEIPGFSSGHIQVIAIGASAGGPIVLNEILRNISDRLPVPIFIVQHIDHSFTHGFADWLTQASGKKIIVARENMQPQPGKIYIPESDHQMGIRPDGNITVNKESPQNGFRPSVGYLFRSVLRVFGNRALSVLLTGMGSDGAQEMKLLKDAGSITIAQDKASSLVFGMPGEAIRLGAACHVLSPENMIRFINEHFKN
jgi:two-component system chemotaxis response regulator CheB